MKAILGWLHVEDWKRAVALVILYAYAYQLIFWPLAHWSQTIMGVIFGGIWPSPPLLPWEHLLAGTTTLGTIGGIAAWRERQASTAVGGTE